MAENSDIIRSFLVSVGVQSDEAGLKRFDKTVGRITGTVFEFAKQMALAAAAVSAGVVKIAGEFEDLYYASQRLRSAVDNIKAFSFGVSQMGGDAKAARASLEAFASFLRTNPAGEGWVRGLGVETRDAAGEAREYADVLRDVGDQLRKMPYWAAKQRADMMGIDENTLQALMRGTDLWSDRYRKMVADAGVDMDKMSKDLVELTQYFRLLKAEIEIGLYKAISAIDPQLLRLSVLLAAVAAVLGLIAVFVSPVVAGIVAIAAAIALLTDDFLGWRNGADSLINWGAWSDEIDSALAGFALLWEGLKEIGRALAPLWDLFSDTFGPLAVQLMAGFFEFVLRGLFAMGHGLKAVAALLRGDWKTALDEYKKGWAAYMGDIDRGGGSKAARAAATSGAANSNKPPINWGAPGGAGNSNGGGSAESRRARALQALMMAGIPRDTALGIVAGMNAENAGLNPGAVGPKVGLNGQKTSGAFGLGQWLGPRKAALFAKYGSNPTFDQQMAFLISELQGGDAGMAKAAKQRGSHAAMRSYIIDGMRPGKGTETTGDLNRGARFLESTNLGTDGGGRTVTINAKTEIKVEGTPEAGEAAKAVGQTVDRRNSDLVRNTRTAVR